MNDIDTRLQQALADLAAQAPHDPDLVATLRRRSRVRWAAPLAAAVAVLLVGGAVLAVRSGGAEPAGDPAATASAPDATAASACQPMTTRVLPEWARTGFSGSEPTATYVLGDQDRIAAITFGPLAAPAEPGSNNKILWAVNPGAAASTDAAPSTGSAVADLRIDGSLEAGTATLHTAVDLGPSIVDVPQPGCWILDLSWPGGSDRVALDYAPTGG